MISSPSKLEMFTGSVCVLLTSVSLKINKNKINLRNHEFVGKKQNGGWKLSDTDWFYFSFYNPSCFFFYDPSWSKCMNFILFLFLYSIRVGPSRSELIRPGLTVRVDPVRLLYLPRKKKLHIRICFAHFSQIELQQLFTGKESRSSAGSCRSPLLHSEGKENLRTER